MQIISETEKALVVKTKGYMVPIAFWVILFVHATLLYKTNDWSGPRAPWSMVKILTAVYVILGVLAHWQWRDTLKIIFHGAKHEVIVERSLPLGNKIEKHYSFDDFTHYELSPALDYGFCRLRTKKGKKIHLFKIRKKDEFLRLRNIDSITRKAVKIINKPAKI